MVAIASVSDWLYQKNKKWLEEVYIKYKDKLEFEGTLIKKKGKLWELLTSIYNAIMYFHKDVKRVYDALGKEFGDIGNLAEYANEVQDEIDKSIEKFWKEKKEISGRDIFVYRPKFPTGSVISSMISAKIMDKTLIIIEEKEENFHVHARRQDQKENMAVFVKRLVNGLEGASGGGHIPAAGAHFLKKDLEKVMERLKEI